MATHPTDTALDGKAPHLAQARLAGMAGMAKTRARRMATRAFPPFFPPSLFFLNGLLFCFRMAHRPPLSHTTVPLCRHDMPTPLSHAPDPLGVPPHPPLLEDAVRALVPPSPPLPHFFFFLLSSFFHSFFHSVSSGGVQLATVLPNQSGHLRGTPLAWAAWAPIHPRSVGVSRGGHSVLRVASTVQGSGASTSTAPAPHANGRRGGGPPTRSTALPLLRPETPQKGLVRHAGQPL
jgi:hypothetical protein